MQYKAFRCTLAHTPRVFHLSVSHAHTVTTRTNIHTRVYIYGPAVATGEPRVLLGDLRSMWCAATARDCIKGFLYTNPHRDSSIALFWCKRPRMRARRLRRIRLCAIARIEFALSLCARVQRARPSEKGNWRTAVGVHRVHSSARARVFLIVYNLRLNSVRIKIVENYRRLYMLCTCTCMYVLDLS